MIDPSTPVDRPAPHDEHAVDACVRDAERLSAVRGTGLLDSAAEEAFDRLTRLAVTLARVPAAFLALVDEERDFFKSTAGMDDAFAARELGGRTFCHHAIRSAAPLVVSDAAAHPVYGAIPTVASMGVRAYVGVPLLVAGQAIGSFCAIDLRPRDWTEAEVQLLAELAASAQREIELRAAARTAVELTAEMRRQAAERDEQRRRLERLNAELTAAHAEARGLFAGLPLPAWVYDVETLEILDVNAAAVAQYGYEHEEFLSLTIRDLRPADELPRLERARVEAQRVGVYRAAFRHRWKDGTIRDVEVTTRNLVAGGRAARLALVQDVTDRLQAEREADAARAEAELAQDRLGFTLAAGGLGSWELALESGVLACSDQCAANLGRAPGSVREYADFVEAIVPEDRERVAAAVSGALAARADYATEYRVRWPDGTEHWIAAHGHAMVDGRGVVTRLTGITHEITDRKRAERERERLLAAERVAREEAEHANAAKAQFLTTMSHELRTPLNAIGGYAQLIALGLRGPVTPQQLHDLGRIQHGQKHLMGLINAVLNYAKLEAGRVQYELADVPVADCVAAVESLVEPQMRAKGLRYEVAPSPSSLAVRADAEKLRQIVLNLLSNAIKFTAVGGQITVRCEPTGSGAGAPVAIQVRDSGVGVAPDKLASVFDPFVQVGRRLNTPDEGIGLGLAISRDLARGMGGDLTAESEPGVGSSFTLVLPAA